MGKNTAFYLALCAFVVVDVVAGHKACTYRQVDLKKRTAPEDECREECRTCTCSA